jgi:prepilin-type N-terminal cleavage/methylation domain-containing protein
LAQIAKIPPKPGQEEIYAKLQAWKAKLGLTAWMLLLTANRNAKGIASSKMKKGTINDMNNSLQTKGFTLLELLVGIIIVNVIGSFVYGRWFAKSPSLKTQEPSNQVVQPAATNTSKKQHTQTIGAIQLSKDQRQEEAASEEVWLFGLCYAMDRVYKVWNPYIERHLAIFVNYF